MLIISNTANLFALTGCHSSDNCDTLNDGAVTTMIQCCNSGGASFLDSVTFSCSNCGGKISIAQLINGLYNYSNNFRAKKSLEYVHYFLQ